MQAEVDTERFDILETFENKNLSGQKWKDYYRVFDKLEKKDYYLMNANPGVLFSFSLDDLDIICQHTWYKVAVGYIATSTKESSCVYLHKLIAEKHHGPRPPGLSVDHINRNKLDNRHTNLRWATQAEQNCNTDKRKRKFNAQPLPDSIQQSDLKKYVVYYKDIENEKEREYFKIEKHPIQDANTQWIGTKSGKVSVAEKLRQANAQVDLYDAMIEQEKKGGEPAPKIQKKSATEKEQEKLEQVQELIEYYRSNGKFPSSRTTDSRLKKLSNLLTDIRRFTRKNSQTCYVAHRKMLDDSGINWIQVS
jgi:hypothetical protein